MLPTCPVNSEMFTEMSEWLSEWVSRVDPTAAVHSVSLTRRYCIIPTDYHHKLHLLTYLSWSSHSTDINIKQKLITNIILSSVNQSGFTVVVDVVDKPAVVLRILHRQTYTTHTHTHTHTLVMLHFMYVLELHQSTHSHITHCVPINWHLTTNRHYCDRTYQN